jgi:hypothetical protein
MDNKARKILNNKFEKNNVFYLSNTFYLICECGLRVSENRLVKLFVHNRKEVTG